MTLDIEQPGALVDYLRREGWVRHDEAVRVRRLAGGVSNRTMLVQRTSAGNGDWVVKQALEKLRVAVDWFSDPRRIEREAAGLDWLNRLVPGVTPRLVFVDPGMHLLAMEAAPQPHENFKDMLLAGRGIEHVERFAAMLASIHAAAWARRDEVQAAFADRQFFESLRLEPYYAYAAQQVAPAAAFLHELIDATRQRQMTLVHGDYSPKNVLVHEDRLVLLDHEVIHWGDPMFDIGFAMAHLLSKARHLPDHRTAFAEAARRFWSTYLAGAPCWEAAEAFAVRHTLGCLLARVSGRSPLEYLSDEQRTKQREKVLALMAGRAQTVEAVIESVASLD